MARISIAASAVTAAKIITLTLLLVGLPGGGCVISVVPNANDNGGNDNGNTDGAQVLTVRLVNTTATTLDPELYVAAEPVTVDQLFAAERKFTAYGVGTIGLLADRDEATLTFNCEEVRVFGTSGGRFGDNLNEPDGTGDRIVLTQDLNVQCGDTVVITYSRASGEFQTSFAVSR